MFKADALFQKYGWLFESHDDPLTHPRTLSDPIRTRFAEGKSTHNTLGVRFQFGTSSLNDHIRRISSAYVCVLGIFSFFAFR